jgi:cupin 2 domain-containing protein
MEVILMIDTYNLYEMPTLPLSEELITVLLRNEGIRIERIVSIGQTSGWYDQEENEFVALLQGEAELTWDDGTTTRLSAGDTITIPKHKRHKVSYTSSEPACIWLCVFWR